MFTSVIADLQASAGHADLDAKRDERTSNVRFGTPSGGPGSILTSHYLLLTLRITQADE
jgi:hypothetical protein